MDESTPPSTPLSLSSSSGFGGHALRLWQRRSSVVSTSLDSLLPVLRRFGVAVPASVTRVTLRSFSTPNGGYRVSFCRYFFVIFSESTKDAVQAGELPEGDETYSVAPAPPAEEIQTSDCARRILNSLESHFLPLVFTEGDTTHSWDEGTRPSSDEMCELISATKPIVSMERSLLRIAGPTFVIGDLHGNYRDLMAFAKSFGLFHSAEFTPCNFLFLGDYVDRGPHSVEVVVFLLAMKRLHPDKVFLLRGNHETEDTNQHDSRAPETCFLARCGEVGISAEEGAGLWIQFNDLFAELPVAAVIDGKIFAVHGGIPRLIGQEPGPFDLLGKIENIRRPLSGERMEDVNELAFDLLWSDPCPKDTPDEELDGTHGFPPGFCESRRGPTAACFSKAATTKFCEMTGCTHILRAHEACMMGLHVSQDARVLTVFSSSLYSGHNRAAAVLVNGTRLQVIMIDSSDDTDT